MNVRDVGVLLFINRPPAKFGLTRLLALSPAAGTSGHVQMEKDCWPLQSLESIMPNRETTRNNMVDV